MRTITEVLRRGVTRRRAVTPDRTGAATYFETLGLVGVLCTAGASALAINPCWPCHGLSSARRGPSRCCYRAKCGHRNHICDAGSGDCTHCTGYPRNPCRRGLPDVADVVGGFAGTIDRTSYTNDGKALKWSCSERCQFSVTLPRTLPGSGAGIIENEISHER